MHTSGLVLTFASDPVLVREAKRELTAAGPFTLGEANGSWQAGTLETTDPKAAHDWHDWATSLPGVAGVEVVFVHWEETEQGVHHVSA